MTNKHVGREHNKERNMKLLHMCNKPIASIPHNSYNSPCLTQCNKEKWQHEPKWTRRVVVVMVVVCVGGEEEGRVRGEEGG